MAALSAGDFVEVDISEVDFAEVDISAVDSTAVDMSEDDSTAVDMSAAVFGAGAEDTPAVATVATGNGSKAWNNHRN